ncbi:uncharacterized protein LOC116288635 [Actinia tenebrosa]|uniref:Uncharacterized protein LOC116288635 n=1 Tax=Actinia tenebrosa TaxID=6105 RepID=A0A6P8H4P1_ACTTE|nr:uncharacterized protein LOC116288635 [Actinia tenebrosa]
MYNIQKRTMHKFSWSAFLLLLGAVLTVKSLAERCVPIEEYSSCACRLNETKQVFNLSPLAPKNASERPRFTANHTTSGWHYSYNPCDGFDLFVSKDNESRAEPCKNVAVARWTASPPEVCFDLGDPDSAVFDYTNINLSRFNLTSVSNLSITFTHVNDTRLKNRAMIYLVCNSNMTYFNQSVFKYLETEYETYSSYYFTLESRCGCPGLCGTPPEKSKGSTKRSKDKKDRTWLIIGISIGAVIILLLVILAVICCRTKRSGYTSI